MPSSTPLCPRVAALDRMQGYVVELLTNTKETCRPMQKWFPMFVEMSCNNGMLPAAALQHLKYATYHAAARDVSSTTLHLLRLLRIIQLTRNTLLVDTMPVRYVGCA